MWSEKISLYIDYFHSVSEGETVAVHTTVIRQGKTVINLKAEVFNSQQKLLA